jgi:predicted DNA-binding transcriptional regulator AlpA
MTDPMATARPARPRRDALAAGRPAAAALLPDLAADLRQLADAVEELAVAEVLGRLEVLRVQLWTAATSPDGRTEAAPAAPSRGLAVAAVVERTGMSRDWLYRQARKGRLPFARRLGRRITFDEAGLARWLGRRR